MSCEYAHFDGAYVLGALSAGERQEFEQHMASCSGCARAVRELAGLPGLLSRVDLDTVEEPQPAEPQPADPPSTLLPRLVGQVRRTQRRRRTGMAAAALAAVAAVTVTSLAVGGVLGDGPEPGGGDGPAASAVAVPSRQMAQVIQGPLEASVALEDVAWGTRLSLTCTYQPGGDSGYGAPDFGDRPAYSLVVTTVDGTTEQVATWQAVPDGTMKVSGATAHPRSDIASVEVRTAAGEPVLRLPT
ncbi:MAG: anti-sigma factor family protein [Nocardioidaceae bacterium]